MATLKTKKNVLYGVCVFRNIYQIDIYNIDSFSVLCYLLP